MGHDETVRAPAVKVWQLEGIEAIRGPVQPVPRILHEDLLIGLLEKGVVEANYRHATHTLRRGTIILCQPGEVVSFEPVDGARPVRTCMSCPSSVLQDLADEMQGSRTGTPFIRRFVAPDQHLAALIREFHQALDAPTSLLESTSRAQDMLTHIIRVHASPVGIGKKVKSEQVMVRRIRKYLDEHAAASISLNDLARIANVSAYHLNRVFRAEVGIPPHAYQTQVRMMRAKSLLAQGVAIDRVAAELGFFDQSHFTNQFRRLFGYTPGTYRDNFLRRP